MSDGLIIPKPRKKLRSLVLLLTTPPLVCAALFACVDFSPKTYEFPSCEPGSKVINVMRVPYTYQSSAADTRIERNQPYGLQSTFIYTTYPDYQPLGLKSWRKYSRMEYESGDPNKLLFATVGFGYGRGLNPENSSYIHDPNAKRKNLIERIREDSIDGQYWAYPPYDQRISKATGSPTDFMPKDTGFHVLIHCNDTGVNAIPSEGQCFIKSDFGDDPNLGCRSVEYRIAAKDMPYWREFDVRVKQQIKSLIRQRMYGYSNTH